MGAATAVYMNKHLNRADGLINRMKTYTGNIQKLLPPTLLDLSHHGNAAAHISVILCISVKLRKSPTDIPIGLSDT